MRAKLAENQKNKALLSEKDRTKAMIDEAATKASETATSTSKKMGRSLSVCYLQPLSRCSVSNRRSLWKGGSFLLLQQKQ